MTTRAGLWIDHRKAVIVTVSSDGEATKTIESDAEGHTRYSGGSHRKPEDMRDRRLGNELVKFYDEVIESIRDVEEILVIGPGEAKGELKARFEHHKLEDRIVAVETVDKMTEPQIAAHVRQHFSGGTP